MSVNEEKVSKWLASFFLKSSLRLPDDLERLDGRYADLNVFIKNVPRAHGEEYFLDLKFVFNAIDLGTASDVAEEWAAEISHTLSFVSGVSVRVHRPVFLVNWDAGRNTREQYVYGRYPIVEPKSALDANMWRTVSVMAEHEVTPAKRSALRWHTRGTRASVLEDQFLYHFFAVEILAGAETFVGKVVDKCPHCRGDLACPNPQCGKPEHRPYPKQKIGLLLREVGLSSGIIAELLELRNLISHGEERPRIEAHMKKRASDFEFEKAILVVEQASTRALHRALNLPQLEPPLIFYYQETWEHITATPRIHVQIGLPGDPDHPDIEDVWMPELSLILTDPKTGDEEVVVVGGKNAKP
jgi:hypothetical protein